MAGPRKKPRWIIVLADVLGRIDEKGIVHDEDASPTDSLLDKLQCPVADEVLIALRRSFSLTYPRNPFIDGLQQALAEIRRGGVDALKTIPEVLKELQLPPVPGTMDDNSSLKAHLFKYSFARESDLKMRVTYEGKKQPLLSLIDVCRGEGVVQALRATVSDTFAEMHTEHQHEEVLRRIRDRIWAVLPAFNPMLEDIEVEPIRQRTVATAE